MIIILPSRFKQSRYTHTSHSLSLYHSPSEANPPFPPFSFLSLDSFLKVGAFHFGSFTGSTNAPCLALLLPLLKALSTHSRLNVSGLSPLRCYCLADFSLSFSFLLLSSRPYPLPTTLPCPDLSSCCLHFFSVPLFASLSSPTLSVAQLTMNDLPAAPLIDIDQTHQIHLD